ncbi:aprataxin and PNK-like factor isoform X2 [Motacilla alba alba]|uniref:aprataxin and PNK-like factor isoform X2 n=1 Tax=Motacilla alba alba TaxID=1094192 RepID=UPI0018D52C95|nr:aprataxin and PNK-like factor isoform X2 [Motacilla alba alba]
MRDMEGSSKTGKTNPENSLEKNDGQLHGKWSKRVGQISGKDNRIEETENKEHIAGSTSQQAHWGRTYPYLSAQEGILEPDANLKYNTGIFDSARSADASESSKQMQHKRTPCKYGSGCSRKNPIHFQQFSHPNDDDYHKWRWWLRMTMTASLSVHMEQLVIGRVRFLISSLVLGTSQRPQVSCCSSSKNNPYWQGSLCPD